MSTLKSVIDQVIFEAKLDSLKLFYDVDVFIQEFKDEKPEVPEEPAPAEVPADTTVGTVNPAPGQPVVDPATVGTPTESFDDEGNLLTEAIYKTKVKGEIAVPKEDALNIQTIQDLVDYIQDKKHSQQSIVEAVLDKKGTAKQVSIISPELQEIILILAGAGTGNGQLADIVDKGDKILVDVDYGTERLNSIGFKINKNAGTDIFTIMLKKDGKVLPGKFDQTILNKQILYFRNSLAD